MKRRSTAKQPGSAKNLSPKTGAIEEGIPATGGQLHGRMDAQDQVSKRARVGNQSEQEIRKKLMNDDVSSKDDVILNSMEEIEAKDDSEVREEEDLHDLTAGRDEIGGESLLKFGSVKKPRINRLRRPTNAYIMLLARTGHIPLFSLVDAGVYRAFENAVVDLVSENVMKSPILKEFAGFLPFIRQDARLGDELCENAGLPSISEYASREQWLQNSPEAKILRYSLEVARQKKLAPLRDTLFKVSKDEFGDDEAIWIKKLTEYGLPVLALNAELYRLWTSELEEKDSSPSEEQRRRGTQIIKMVYRGMQEYLRPSQIDQCFAHYVMFGEEDLQNPRVLLLGSVNDNSSTKEKMRIRAAVFAEGFVTLLLHAIAEEAHAMLEVQSTTSYAQRGTARESCSGTIGGSSPYERMTSKSSPGVGSSSEKVKKKSPLPRPFDAILSVSSLSNGFQGASNAVKDTCPTFTDFIVTQLLFQRENELYVSTIGNLYMDIAKKETILTETYDAEKRRLQGLAFAPKFVVSQRKKKATF